MEKSFIHGMTSEELCAEVQDHDFKDPVTVSLDGSAFDSTQFSDLMKCVDSKFWKGCEPQLVEMFRDPRN